MNLVSISENKQLEKRIAITPEMAKKYIDLGFKLFLPNGYGVNLGFEDDEYKNLGVSLLENEKDGVTVFSVSKNTFFRQVFRFDSIHGFN